ncbi:arginyltransferase [Leptospira fainei serovar Hurstbridge str. BUT 6]|uniref:Arginyltransferase n=1 Tax=Leptospira fainei serovar Hurstbridge str. BUT 6 TaxID=1193011 RepID=S3UZP7_9LEPT|nr:arginyltransferase [Leptospira fainei]EPG75901.1 arginyltransferase [Leptospira fainei serovar Hurstbridge str. BUT 6]
MNLRYLRFLESISVSPSSDCSYYPGRQSKVKGFLLSVPPDGLVLDFLLGSGFRRSGNSYYRTACENCSHCLSYRLPVQKFTISKNLKKLLKKNSDLSVNVSDPEITSEKVDLYIKYQKSRHPGSYGSTDLELHETMAAQMYRGSENSIELQIRREAKLLGWILLDLGELCVSAVYSIFDSEYQERSLGRFLIAKSILWAKENDYRDYHLGLFLPGHKKMSYKGDWKPAEILNQETGDWIESEKFLKEYFSKVGIDGSRL